MKKILLLSAITSSLFAMSSQEVAKRAYNALSGYKSSISYATITIKNPSGAKKEVKLEIKRLESKNGDKSMATFLSPKNLKGTKLLSYEVVGGDAKQWIYIPSLKMIKRVSSRKKQGTLMGSEFSYEDISSQNYKSYKYSADAKEEIIDNIAYYKITRVPKSANSAYSKQVIWVKKANFLPSEGEYYDKQNRLFKRVYFLKYKHIDKVARVVKMKIVNAQNNKSSTLTVTKDKIDAHINSNAFAKSALKR